MNYYEILEVSEKSSGEVIAGAYRALTKKYHPDVSSDAASIEKMKTINLAYEVLSDPRKRAEYDRTLQRDRAARAPAAPRPNSAAGYEARQAAQRAAEQRERAKRQAEERAQDEARMRQYRQEAERRAAERRERERQHRKSVRRFLLLVLALSVLLLVYLIKHKPELYGGSGGAPFGSSFLSEKEAAASLQEAKSRVRSGDYYGAMKAIEACRAKAPHSEAAAECEALIDRMAEALRDGEPQNGATLARTFEYMGGCTLRVTAESGPAIVTVRDKSDPDACVAVYVRKGQTADVPVTGGTYRVEYTVGSLWFDDQTGFGEFCTTGAFEDDFVFKVDSAFGWTSNSVLEVTV